MKKHGHTTVSGFMRMILIKFFDKGIDGTEKQSYFYAKDEVGGSNPSLAERLVSSVGRARKYLSLILSVKILQVAIDAVTSFGEKHSFKIYPCKTIGIVTEKRSPAN